MGVPKIVFIVPYRNREHEKLHFSIYMQYIMEDYDINDYEIYYSNQIDNKPFSRGGTKNIGFLAIKNKYPDDYKNITFVFNDVDTLPCVKNSLDYITTTGTIKHFFGFTFTLGGIFSITGGDFEKCDGFPNLYGWGLEDNAMLDRVTRNKMKIDRDVFYIPGKGNDIISLTSGPMRLINDKDPSNYNLRRFNDNLTNIKNLDYTIISNKENAIKKNTNEFIINILKFDSLLSHIAGEFYLKDISKGSKLYPNLLQKQRTRSLWSMNRFMK
tara:strand:+ start:3088 stop:3897 length:810 start_codon:yes stop_codon:yes gene_type:complete